MEELIHSPWFPREKFSTSQKKFPLSISVLSWALNEEENIEEFLKRMQQFISSFCDDFEHILIDDGSTDRTFEIASDFKAKYPQLVLIKNKMNIGSGWNTRIAVSRASKEILFWQTVDWSYDISQIDKHVWLLKKYDVVQGVRNLESGISACSWNALLARSDSVGKAIISFSNYWLIRLLFRVPVLDFQNVTIYPTKLAQQFKLRSASAFTNPELLLRAYWCGANICQVPISFIPRSKGKGHGTRFKVIAKSILDILGFWIRWLSEEKVKKGTISLSLDS